MKTSNKAHEELEGIVQAVADSYQLGRPIDSLESTALPNSRKIIEAIGDLDLFIGSNLALTNLTGHPEISLPNGFFRGSPTSLRFTGKLFGEAEILLLAHAYQAATDHHLQHPTL